jgi:hypothetical protein
MCVGNVDATLARHSADCPDGRERLMWECDDGIEGIEVVAGQRRFQPVRERQHMAELGCRRHMGTDGRDNATTECLGDV